MNTEKNPYALLPLICPTAVPVRNPKRVKEKLYLPYNTQILVVVIIGGRHTGDVFSSVYSRIFENFIMNIYM